MNIECPHCLKELPLSEGHKEKILDALAKLVGDRYLKMGCPLCREPIHLGRDGTVRRMKTSVSAVLPPEKEDSKKPEAEANRAAEPPPAMPRPVNQPPEPPQPPALDWLAGGDFAEKEVIEDVPMALFLTSNREVATALTGCFEEMGYRPEQPATAQEAIDRMRFVDFGAVALHVGLEDVPIEENLFHAHMAALGMDKRRTMFYFLIGPDFRTLYDLEALARSANLVVNEHDIVHLPTILKKAVPESEELFMPLIETMRAHGRK